MKYINLNDFAHMVKVVDNIIALIGDTAQSMGILNTWMYVYFSSYEVPFVVTEELFKNAILEMDRYGIHYDQYSAIFIAFEDEPDKHYCFMMNIASIEDFAELVKRVNKVKVFL